MVFSDENGVTIEKGQLVDEKIELINTSDSAKKYGIKWKWRSKMMPYVSYLPIFL